MNAGLIDQELTDNLLNKLVEKTEQNEIFWVDYSPRFKDWSHFSCKLDGLKIDLKHDDLDCYAWFVRIFNGREVIVGDMKNSALPSIVKEKIKGRIQRVQHFKINKFLDKIHNLLAQ